MSHRPHRRLLVAAISICCAALLGASAPVTAYGDPRPTRDPITDIAAVRDRLDRLTSTVRVPGALAQVRDRHGRSVTVRSGAAELGDARPMVGRAGRFRIASASKSFVAVAVMQLVVDGRVRLDAPIDAYLPGVIRGRGEGAEIDGRRITVRHLLQHTSGLPEYSDAVDWSDLPEGPRGFLALALTREPTDVPGAQLSYANTNYLVAGMLVESVTGQDFRVATTRGILRPLGLRHTYWPARGEFGLRGPHAHTYGVHPARPDGGVVDTTEFPGYLLGASGGLVSTPTDLNRFWDGLFSGRLLPRWAVRAMTSGPVAADELVPGATYGLGITRVPLSCGWFWGHGGSVFPGVMVVSGRTPDGRQVTTYVTGAPETAADVLSVIDTALCRPAGD